MQNKYIICMNVKPCLSTPSTYPKHGKAEFLLSARSQV